MNGVVEEFWTDIGFPWRGLIMDRKIGRPTLHLDCDFSRPSIFGDLLTFKLAVRRVGRASLHLAHVVSGEDGLRWKAYQTVVATSLANHLAIA
jgi:4-hydroxybenzoyl-CoA thioesterase